MPKLRSEIPATELKSLLDEKYRQFNTADFIVNDPISIPHRFTDKNDIAIAGFFAATIAWGNRKSILANASRLMEWMDHSPHQFIVNYSTRDLKPFEKFTHRTFNGTDCVFFLRTLRHIYENHGGLEKAFNHGTGLKSRITEFRKIFFGIAHPLRTEKHVSSPDRKSSAKRLCMFLRWMVRKDSVDFGIWKSIRPAELCLPLDVHTGRVSRVLGLLKRKQNDWEAVEEITESLRKFDPRDPVKYDLALFGMGVAGEL